MKHLIVLALLLAGSCAAPPPDVGQAPDPGAQYAATVFTHCGFYEVDFAGVSWTPASIERGSMPVGTDGMATEGTFELVSNDALLFRADSGLEVRFAPAPSELEPIPACD